MGKARKAIATGLTLLTLTGCNGNNNYPQIVEEPVLTQIVDINRPSYKLEDLCDTEIDWKPITLYVYVKPSEDLWEFHKYKEKIFPYVSDFFKEQKINCEVIYSNEPLKSFNSSNEFGIEILDSHKEKEDRYWQLSTGLEKIPEHTGLVLVFASQAVTRAGIALTYGKRQGPEGMDQKGIDKMTLKIYENWEEFPLKNWATHFSHEILHCMSLFHTGRFVPEIIEETDVPNIMSPYDPLTIPRFTEQNTLGQCLTPTQQKLIHSFIEGKNNYKAFKASERDLLFYINNLAKDNNSELEY